MNYFFTWLELNSFLINTTQRVEFFTKNDSKCWTPFWIWLKELNFFCTGLKELNFFQYVSKNWAFFFKIWVQNWIFFLKKNTIPKNDSKNWTFSKHDSQNRIPFEKDSKNWTLFCFFFNDSKNWTFLVFQYDSKNWFFQNAQGIEPLFHMNYFFTWLELNSFLINTTRRVKFFHKKWLKVLNTFLNMTQWIDFFLKKNDAKFFFEKIWFEEWNLLENMTFKQKHDSNNWTLFTLTRRTFF